MILEIEKCGSGVWMVRYQSRKGGTDTYTYRNGLLRALFVTAWLAATATKNAPDRGADHG